MDVNKEEMIRAYKMMTKFLEKLDDEKLIQWLNGELKLTLQEVNHHKKAEKEEVQVSLEYIEHLKNLKSYEEASTYLKTLKLNKEQLKVLAKEVSACIKSRDNKEVIQNKIIENTVGTKLKIEILSKKQ